MGASRSLRRWKPLAKVDKILKGLEDETRFIMVDGKPVSVKAIIDRILSEDREKDKRRRLATG